MEMTRDLIKILRHWSGRVSFMWPVIPSLLAYCLVISIVTGDIGFEGDDWWIFSWAYWYSFPTSLLAYARAALRPVEGIYWLTLFELFGFDKIAFHFFSLLLLAGASLLMGMSLSRAFPRKRGFVLASIFFAFFMPTVSCLTFVMTTDNSRLCMLLFWASVLAFQRWGEKSPRWTGLILPCSLYLLAFLTYEAAGFLIFVTPLLVIPVHLRKRDGTLDRRFLFQISVGILTAFSATGAVRFVFLGGGAVVLEHIVPPLELMGAYLALLPFYLAAPFTEIPALSFEGIVGLAAALVTGTALLLTANNADNSGISQGESWCEQSRLYVFLVGGAVALLGLVPYLMAGYGSGTPKLLDSLLSQCGLLPNGNSAWFNFNWSSRIYSSASFGVAILFGGLVDYWRSKRVEFASRITAAVVIGLFAAFHAGFVPEWQGASRIRTNLCRDLISQIPDVKPHTNLVLVNMDSRYKRAVIFRGWMGLRALVQMLYDEHDLSAYYIYPHAWKWPNHMYQRAFVTPEGFVSRGVAMNRPVPHETLLILYRRGDDLTLLKSVQPDQGLAPTGISWERWSQLKSNLNKIAAPATPIPDARRADLNSELREEICGRQQDQD